MCGAPEKPGAEAVDSVPGLASTTAPTGLKAATGIPLVVAPRPGASEGQGRVGRVGHGPGWRRNEGVVSGHGQEQGR